MDDNKDEKLKNIRCSKCGSDKLKLSVDRSFTLGYIKCYNCNNFDTREIINGQLSNLVRCDICGGTTTKIISPEGYEYPLWHIGLFESLEIFHTLCDNCKEKHFYELEEKNEKLQRIEAENRAIELEELYKEEEKYTKTINLTEHQLEYLLGLVKEDDDFARDMCLNEDIESDYEFEIRTKVYEKWQNNLKTKIESILNLE